MAELVGNGQEFLQSMDWKLDPQKGLQAGGVEDRVRHARVMEAKEEVHRIGFEHATIVNCMPFDAEIRVSFGPGIFKVRGADWKKKEVFFPYTFKVAYYDNRDMGDAKYSIEKVFPVQLAMEFLKKYEEYGGIFMYRGEAPPADFAEQVDKARERMKEWALNQYNLANDLWQRFNKQTRHITPHMRSAATFLMETRLIDNLPEWQSITRDIAGTKLCPMCAETIKAAAKICRFCGTVLDSEAQVVTAQRQVVPVQTEEPEEKEAVAFADDFTGPSDEAVLDGAVIEPQSKTVTKQKQVKK